VSQNSGALAWTHYLAFRGASRVSNWETWVANSKFDSDSDRAQAENAVLVNDARQQPGSVSYLEMHNVLRLIVQKVMTENGIDAFVNPENTLPPYKIGGPDEPVVLWRDTNSCCQRLTAIMGAPEMEVPAGYTQVVYEPSYVLNENRTRYETKTGTVETRLPKPFPISLMLWAGAGSEPDLIRLASAYEAATRHRIAPPDFGPVD
jgi:Asp-tRNA(Asn)/Glu-tRNA(Gln) amidotransferase A subunit family amidase